MDPAAAAAKRSLLVVDDDEDFRRSLAEALQLEGWHVVEAANGAQALEWLSRGERPSAVLLDMWMPQMDGWQFWRELGHRSNGDVAVVVMTAARTQDAELPAVTDVIEKPFTLPHLIAVLERHVG
jgi:CheY-like chemotaxis protein